MKIALEIESIVAEKIVKYSPYYMNSKEVRISSSHHDFSFSLAVQMFLIKLPRTVYIHQ